MLDLQELIRSNKPIYVKNRTGRFLEQPGPYVLEIREAGKQAASVVIPATKYPFLLSGHVPVKLLADSTEFYAALSKGILELLDPDEAKREMADPIAQQVVDNAMRKFQPTRRESKPPPELVTANNRNDRTPPGADKGISGLPAESRTPMRVAASDEADIENPDVNPTVLQIVMDLSSDPDLKEEKFLELAAMENLTEDDLGYLLANCKPFTKIVQWARGELADKVGEETAAYLEQKQAVQESAQPSRRRRRK